MDHFHNKTKIVATIGPGSESKEVFKKLLHAGVNVARTNMSHDDQATHEKRIKTIRDVAKKEKMPVAILQDLSGPKIRIGDFAHNVVELIAGEQFILSGTKCSGTAERVYFNYPFIKKDIMPGMILMLDDGKKKLRVEKVMKGDVVTTVLVGGTIKSRRGVNIPGAYLSISAMTNKDRSDIVFGVKMNVDFIALSFVRTAKDIVALRQIIKRRKGRQAIIAKIETEEAVENIDEIIEVSDGIMVARGDLAIEIGPAKVPSIQKMIVRKCNEVGKPVIVATQMLESMITTPVPTRAEVSDVANAIFDGTDAVMLSEETALGKYAVDAVTTMRGIAEQVEGEIRTHRRHQVHTNDIVDSISSSVVHDAEDVGASIIVALTEAGSTPRMIARYKPRQHIIALTPHEHIARQMNIVFGCEAMIIETFKSLKQVIKVLGPKLIRAGHAKKGDRIILTAGIPFGTTGSTNMLMILTV